MWLGLDLLTWALLGGVVLALLLLGLLLAAWRGRRVGEGTRCARCDYLLEGLSNESRCPECGTEFSRTTGRNIATGGRRRSWRAVAACMILLLATGLGERTLVHQWLNRPADRQPTWLLLHEANKNASPLALKELRARETLNQLNQKQHSQFIDAIITQRGTGVSNDDHWMLGERQVGKVSDAQWKRLFDRFPPSVKMRPVVSSAEPFELDINADYSFMSQGCFGPSVMYHATGLAIDGTPVSEFPGQGEIDLAQLCPNLRSGKHELTVKLSATMHTLPSDYEKEQWTGSHTLTFTYLTDGSSTVNRLTDSKDLENLKNQIRPVLTFDGKRVEVGFSFPSGIPLCHDAKVRIDGETRDLFTVKASSGACGTYTSLDELVSSPTKRVDLILSPNPREAAKTTDIHSLVDREIVFSQVAIEKK